MLPELYKKKINFLKRVSKKSLKHQKKIFSGCPERIIKDVSKLFHNICNNKKIVLNPRQIKKLLKYRKFLRGINKIKKNKRKYLVKNISGGFLSALIPLLVNVIAGIGSQFL
ncbi:MAG: hypothetical protein HRT42_06880 [Campylobacteraceae bacterium]|nr:hypothetical protein [Campylobacteraceae bacterium]